VAWTQKVTYKVSLKKSGFRPEPYAIGDALMYADGKPIVEVKDISLRLSGMTPERVDGIWRRTSRSTLRVECDASTLCVDASAPPNATSTQSVDVGIRRGA